MLDGAVVLQYVGTDGRRQVGRPEQLDVEIVDRGAGKRPLVEGHIARPGALCEDKLFFAGGAPGTGTDPDPDDAVEAHRAHTRCVDDDVQTVSPGEDRLLHDHDRPRQDVGLVANVGNPEDQGIVDRQPGRGAVVLDADEQVPSPPFRQVVGKCADRLA